MQTWHPGPSASEGLQLEGTFIAFVSCWVHRRERKGERGGRGGGGGKEREGESREEAVR